MKFPVIIFALIFHLTAVNYAPLASNGFLRGSASPSLLPNARGDAAGCSSALLEAPG